MTVWNSEIERNCWTEQWCERCYQPDEAAMRATGKGEGCPARGCADAGALPLVWHKRKENRLGDTYRCDLFLGKPATNRRPSSPCETIPMFDVEPIAEDVDHQ